MPWPRLAIETIRDGDDVSLIVQGELDLATGSSLEHAVTALLPEQPVRVLLDLHQLTFCDSSGIASLIRIRHAAAAVGASLVLHSLDERVWKVLEIGGVREILGVRSTNPSG